MQRKVVAGTLVGLLLGAFGGAVLGSIAGAAEDEGAVLALLSAFFYGGVGAGMGAAIGAAFRKHTLIYRVPRPGTAPSPTVSGSGSWTGALSETPLPAACRVFSTEQPAQELSHELAGTQREKSR